MTTFVITPTYLFSHFLYLSRKSELDHQVTSGYAKILYAIRCILLILTGIKNKIYTYYHVIAVSDQIKPSTIPYLYLKTKYALLVVTCRNHKRRINILYLYFIEKMHLHFLPVFHIQHVFLFLTSLQ